VTERNIYVTEGRYFKETANFGTFNLLNII